MNIVLFDYYCIGLLTGSSHKRRYHVPLPIYSADITVKMSSSASSADTTLSKKMTSLYECPVCFEYIQPPIYQCTNGHVVRSFSLVVGTKVT